MNITQKMPISPEKLDEQHQYNDEGIIQENHNKNKWKAIIPLNIYSPPSIKSNILPNIYGEFSSAVAKSFEVPEEFTTILALGIVGTVLGGRVFSEIKKGWVEPSNIYSAVIMPVGSMKSPTLKVFRKPIDVFEKNKQELLEPIVKEKSSEFLNIQSQIEGKRKKLSSPSVKDEDATKIVEEIAELEASLPEIPSIPEIYITDVTPETLARVLDEQNSKVAIISDEAGVLHVLAGLYSKKQANVNVILNGWDGGRVKIRRSNEKIYLNPYLSALITIQPDVLADIGEQKSFKGNGVLERFLYVVPTCGKKTFDAPELSEKLEKDYNTAILSLLEEVYRLENEPFYMKLSPQAKSTFLDFSRAIEDDYFGIARLTSIAGWASKLRGQAIRIANILHVMKNGNFKNNEISLTTIEEAIEISLKLSEHSLCAYNVMRVGENDKNIQFLLNAISGQNSVKIKKSEMTTLMKHRCNAEELENIVNLLAEHNYTSKVYSSDKTSPPTKWIDINPQLFNEKSGNYGNYAP